MPHEDGQPSLCWQGPGSHHSLPLWCLPFAICKKRSGDLRPIAVGEVLRRLTSKCVARAVRAEALGILSPLQVGVGIPAGCEAIVHAVLNVQDDSSITPGTFLLFSWTFPMHSIQ